MGLSLLTKMASASTDVRMAAVQELARGWKDDPHTLPWLKDRTRADADNNVRMVAVQELARGWKDDPETLPWLKDHARSEVQLEPGEDGVRNALGRRVRADQPGIVGKRVGPLLRGGDPFGLRIHRGLYAHPDRWRRRQPAIPGGGLDRCGHPDRECLAADVREYDLRGHARVRQQR